VEKFCFFEENFPPPEKADPTPAAQILPIPTWVKILPQNGSDYFSQNFMQPF